MDNIADQAAFARCIDFLVRMLEKYGDVLEDTSDYKDGEED